MNWLENHWKTIAVIAASTAAFIAVTVLTGGLDLPAIACVAAGGLASGAVGYSMDRWLNKKPWNFEEFALATTVSGLISAATFGTCQLLAPVVTPVVDSVVPEAVTQAVPQVVRTAATNAAVGGSVGAGTQVVQNAVQGKPLTQNVGTAAGTGAVVAVVAAPATQALAGALNGTTAAAPSVGISGRLEGLTGPNESTAATPRASSATTTTAEPGTTQAPATQTSDTTAIKGALGESASTSLDALYPRRALLGSGNYKETFATDSPNVVLRAVKPSTGGDLASQTKILDQEDGMLAQLEQQGVPAMKVVERGTVTIDGQTRAADVVERYAAGSKGSGNDANAVNPDFLKYANENTLADLAAIRATLQEKGLAVADIQFLIQPSGHVVVADPLGIYRTAEIPTIQPDWMRAWAERCDWQIGFTQWSVQQAIAARAASATATPTPVATGS